jgi:hypothetical protein
MVRADLASTATAMSSITKSASIPLTSRQWLISANRSAYEL